MPRSPLPAPARACLAEHSDEVPAADHERVATAAWRAAEHATTPWQAGEPTEGLAHYARRFDDVLTEAELLVSRLSSGGADAKHTLGSARTLRDGLAEARAYVAHPVLGPRLVQAARALVEQPSDDPVAVLGPTDAMKLRSSMTLFAAADPDQPVYGEVLAKFFDGEADEATLARL